MQANSDGKIKTDKNLVSSDDSGSETSSGYHTASDGQDDQESVQFAPEDQPRNSSQSGLFSTLYNAATSTISSIKNTAFGNKAFLPSNDEDEDEDTKKTEQQFENEAEEAESIYDQLHFSVEGDTSGEKIKPEVKREIINRIASNNLNLESLIVEKELQDNSDSINQNENDPLKKAYLSYIALGAAKAEAARKAVIFIILKDLYIQEIIQRNTKPGSVYTPNMGDMEKASRLATKELSRIINKNLEIMANSFTTEKRVIKSYDSTDKTEVKDTASIYFAINKYHHAASLDWTFHSYNAINKKSEANLIKAINIAADHGLEIIPRIGESKELLNPCNLSYKTVVALASAHEYVKNKENAVIANDDSDKNIEQDIADIYALGLLSYAVHDINLFNQKIEYLKGNVDGYTLKEILESVRGYSNKNDNVNLLSVYSKRLYDDFVKKEKNWKQEDLLKKIDSIKLDNVQPGNKKYFTDFIVGKYETQEKIEKNRRIQMGAFIDTVTYGKTTKIESSSNLSGANLKLQNTVTKKGDPNKLNKLQNNMEKP